MRKPVGSPGNWFAEIGGTSLPCVHRHWVRGGLHDDPNVVDSRDYQRLISGIREKGYVILTTDEVIDEKKSFKRTGYIAIFGVKDLEVAGTHLTFRLGEKIEFDDWIANPRV